MTILIRDYAYFEGISARVSIQHVGRDQPVLAGLMTKKILP